MPQETLERLEGKIDECLKDHTRTANALEAIDTRLRTVERLVWIAMGGVIVLGVLMNHAIGVVTKHL